MKMRSLLLPILFAAVLVACGDSNPSGPKAGPPANLLILAGDNQTGVAGQPTTVSPSVLVIDANNLPVSGVTVTFAIVSGGGSLSSATQTTDSEGAATVTWTLGSAFGPKVLQATAGALGPVIFNAVAVASGAGTLAFNQADPAGDTVASSGQPEPRAVDLLSLRGDFKVDSLILTLTFAAPVAPASAFVANSVGGYIEIDIDDNFTTGAPPESNFFGASANLGIEYIVSLFEGSSNSVELLSFAGFETVPASFSGNIVVVRIPMSLLENDEGNFGIVGVLGTLDRPTDVVPNSGAIAVRRTMAGASGSIAKRLGDTNMPRVPSRRVIWGGTGLRVAR